MSGVLAVTRFEVVADEGKAKGLKGFRRRMKRNMKSEERGDEEKGKRKRVFCEENSESIFVMLVRRISQNGV